MRYVGRIRDWNDAKGYGFVEPNGGGERAFVHVRAFERKGRRPIDGDLVSYVVQRSGARGSSAGRINAAQVRYAGASWLSRREAPAPGATARWPRRSLAVMSLAGIGAAWGMGAIPDALVALYALMSLFAIAMYKRDKSAARSGRRRTPETTLHAVALLGGWPGALLAQGLFRHKSSKGSFQRVFWATVLANLVAVAWLLGGGVLPV